MTTYTAQGIVILCAFLVLLGAITIPFLSHWIRSKRYTTPATPSPVKVIHIGTKAEMVRTVTTTDIGLFGHVSGDTNPAHFDENWVIAHTKFRGRIAHGMYTASLISAVLGMQLPGPGTIYLGQTLHFLAPVYLGDTLTIRVRVIAIEKRKVSLYTTVTNQDGSLVLDGEALVLPPVETQLVNPPALVAAASE